MLSTTQSLIKNIPIRLLRYDIILDILNCQSKEITEMKYQGIWLSLFMWQLYKGRKKYFNFSGGHNDLRNDSLYAQVLDFFEDIFLK